MGKAEKRWEMVGNRYIHVLGTAVGAIIDLGTAMGPYIHVLGTALGPYSPPAISPYRSRNCNGALYSCSRSCNESTWARAWAWARARAWARAWAGAWARAPRFARWAGPGARAPSFGQATFLEFDFFKI